MTRPKASQPVPAQRAPAWVRTTLTHAAAPKTAPSTAGTGTSAPRTRTLPGIR